jgi:putative exporter of polyketide antibiotics
VSPVSEAVSEAVPLVVAHLGELHAYEQWLVLLVAFGPFVVLGVVVAVVRRRDVAAELDQEAPLHQGAESGQAGPSASQDAPT